jgi:regulatory protein
VASRQDTAFLNSRASKGPVLTTSKPGRRRIGKMSYKITELKLQKRNSRRINVFLNGEYAFGLSRIVAAWLRVGQELSDEEIRSLKEKDARESALQQALTFLSYRTRSEVEVRRNLEEHKYSEEVISEILERLRQNGLVNDQHFAQTWVDNRSTFRPRSRKALSIELRRRGLGDQEIEQALDGIDDNEMAYQAAQKQLRKIDAGDWAIFRKKMTEFLARRGFSYQAALDAVQRVWEERNTET